MSYNGWKNKETWLVSLWLGDVFAADQEEGFEITAEYIESHIEMLLDDERISNSLISDLLNSALGEIDYHEIAAHYKTEAAA